MAAITQIQIAQALTIRAIAQVQAMADLVVVYGVQALTIAIHAQAVMQTATAQRLNAQPI